jgi:hypothetical protein
MTDAEIRRFAKHYAISLRLARDICQTGGNWAKAFDLVVVRIRQIPRQENPSMTTLTVDNDGNITAYVAPEQAQDALALGAQMFASQKELAKLAAEWPTSRLVETWNGFAGTPGFDDLKPVKKFTDRKVAISRIWQAIQKLTPAANGGAQGAPEAAAATTEPTSKKKAARGARGVRKAKTGKAAKPRADAAAPRDGSKKQIVLDLLRRKGGATMAEIAKATDWQNHSIRGFISGVLTKRMRLAVESSKNSTGERTYRLK